MWQLRFVPAALLCSVFFLNDRVQTSVLTANIHRLSRSASLLGPAVPFCQIVGGPEGLKIGEVASDCKLCRVGEVERLQGPNVVEVPKVAILPRHFREELALNMGSKVAQ